MKKDSFLFGVLVSVASIVLTAAIVAGIMLACGIPAPFDGKLKNFLLAFVPAILLLRYYTKNLQFMKTAKAIAVVLFVTLTAYIVFLVRSFEVMLK